MKKLTRLNDKGMPILKKEMQIMKAINILYNYEQTNVSPKEIFEMKQTISKLQERIRKFEQW